MTRRVGALLALLATLAVLGSAPAAAAQNDTGWTITSFDTRITVDNDGLLHVVEDIQVDFGFQQKHGIYREIPVRYRYDDTYDRLIDVSAIRVVGAEGTPDDLDVSTNGDYLVLRIGHPDVLITGRHAYRISYTVRGALNSFESHEELYWNATGNIWPVPILRASAVVSGPRITNATCFEGPEGSTGLCTSSQVGEREVTFGAEQMQPGEGLTIVVGFPPASVPVGEPILDERFAFSRAFAVNPGTIIGALLVLLLGGAAVARLIWREGRDRVLVGPQGAPGSEQAKPMGKDAIAVEFRPPDGLKPAQLGVIIDERVDNHDVSATIVDLAVRGHLTIEQREEKKFIWFSATEWVLHYRENPQDQLEDYERLLYNALFESGPEVHLSELTGSFATEYQRVQKALYREAQHRGWFARRPDKVRDKYAAFGFLGTAAAVGLVVLMAMFTHYALIALALVPAALAFWVLHRFMPRRTPLGSDLLRRTLGFREFILTAETGRMQFAEEENIFAKYLPYAVMFVAVDKWARAFADLATGPTVTSSPYGYVAYPWYIGGIAGSFDLPSFSAALSDFSARAGSSLSTRPASSGSSGFGGGGSSGGGMGGGGGGSW